MIKIGNEYYLEISCGMAKHIKKALILYGAYLENDLIIGENDNYLEECKNAEN